MVNEFHSADPSNFQLTDEMREAFDRDGYIIMRQHFGPKELTRIKSALEGDRSVWEQSFSVEAKDGTSSRLCIWSNPGNDITGIVARCNKMAGTCEQLLGGEVYHYHSKLMMKEARTGGKFVWHQDYGYWYQNGNLFPDMMTAFVAVDPCTMENGCLQVIPGSHKCGRVDHAFVDGQQGADTNRVDQIMSVLQPIHVLLEPGDVLFFHANVLHCSSANRSQSRRWALLVAYNRKSNNPVKVHQHPCYRPLHKVPDLDLMTCPLTLDDPEVKEFMDPASSKTMKNVVREKDKMAAKSQGFQ